MLEGIKKELNYNLARHSTFRIGSQAEIVYIPSCIEELVKVLKVHPTAVIIGAGSNLIISSGGLKSPVVLTKELSCVSIEGQDVECECGVKTALLSQKALEHGLSGMEFLWCIPASIGGVVAMNASAHKQSIKDIIVSAKLFNLESREVEEFSKEQLQLDYRQSIIEGRYVVLSAKFRLEPADKLLIDNRMQANKAYRRARHPSMRTPNAGSTFKNPEGEIAGKLIDDAGLKGRCVGGACVSDVHANFLINQGGATSSDLLNLMFEIKSEIQEKYGYNLKPEVKYIGDKSEKEFELWQKLNS